MTTTANQPLAAEHDPLIQEMVSCFRSYRSVATGGRAARCHFRKFESLVRKLMPVVGPEHLAAEFTTYLYYSDGREAREIIASLAPAKSSAAVPQPKQPPTPVIPKVDNKTLAKHLTKATAELIAALKLLNPQGAGGGLA